jgi:hypothetical protein
MRPIEIAAPKRPPRLSLPAHPDQVVRHDDKLIQIGRVLGENMIESGSDCGQWDQRTEAKQDHAGMRQKLDEDEFTRAEISRFGASEGSLSISGLTVIFHHRRSSKQ